jgi:carbonic anhydrase
MNNLVREIFLEGNLKYQWKISQGLEKINRENKIPKYPVMILTCMDHRIDVHKIFQLNPGEVLILRNAGNVYSKDVLRSMLLVINKYNIKYFIVLGHLDCAMTKISADNLKEKLSPSLIHHFGSVGVNLEEHLSKFFKIFNDELRNINEVVYFLKKFPDFPNDLQIIGMLYDVNTGWIFDSETVKVMQSKDIFLKEYGGLLDEKDIALRKYIDNVKPEEIKNQKNEFDINSNSKTNEESLVSNQIIQNEQSNSEEKILLKEFNSYISEHLNKVYIKPVKINFNKLEGINFNIIKLRKVEYNYINNKVRVNIPVINIMNKLQGRKTPENFNE